MSGEISKHDLRVQQQILFTLVKTVETFPEYTVAQHLKHFLRKKAEKADAYYWTNDVLLSKLEAYYDELKNDLVASKQETNG